MKKHYSWKIRVLSLFCTIVISALVYIIKVPAPDIILTTAIVFFTYVGGFSSGAISAGVVVAYLLLFYSNPAQPFHYTAENLYKVITFLIFIPILVSLIGALKKSETVKSEKLKAANAELSRLARMDYLTGLPNRRYFDEKLNDVFQQSAGKTVCCALLDIDFFKQFNDNYGHIAGDNCLSQIAQMLKQVTRQPNQFAARFGGEEFIILFANTSMDAAYEICERILRYVEGLRIPHGYSSISPYVTVSIGLSTLTVFGQSGAKWLLEKADKALYLAKTNGRNRIETLSANLPQTPIDTRYYFRGR